VRQEFKADIEELLADLYRDRGDTQIGRASDMETFSKFVLALMSSLAVVLVIVFVLNCMIIAFSRPSTVENVGYAIAAAIVIGSGMLSLAIASRK
jgi:hypothetical protein